MIEILEEKFCFWWNALHIYLYSFQSSWAPVVVKNPPAKQETWVWVQSLDREDLLQKEMATHSSILAWRILGTEELGRL